MKKQIEGYKQEAVHTLADQRAVAAACGAGFILLNHLCFERVTRPPVSSLKAVMRRLACHFWRSNILVGLGWVGMGLA